MSKIYFHISGGVLQQVATNSKKLQVFCWDEDDDPREPGQPVWLKTKLLRAGYIPPARFAMYFLRPKHLKGKII